MTPQTKKQKRENALAYWKKELEKIADRPCYRREYIKHQIQLISSELEKS